MIKKKHLAAGAAYGCVKSCKGKLSTSGLTIGWG